MTQFKFSLAIANQVFKHWLLRIGYILGGSVLITTTVVFLSSRVIMEFLHDSIAYDDQVIFAIACGLMLFIALLYLTRNWWLSETVGEWERSGDAHASEISKLERRRFTNKCAK